MPAISATLLNRINPIMDTLKPAAIRAFDAQISDIPDIIKLTIGEPDFDAPAKIKAAAVASIKNNDSHYGKTQGSLALRTAISDFLHRKYDLEYAPTSEVIVTVGAMEALETSLRTILKPGDKVIVPTPGYPMYLSILASLGAVPVCVNTAANGFKLSPAQLATTLTEHQAKAIIFNFPSNPTGVTYTAEELAELATVMQQHDIFVVADEIYSEFTYGKPHVSLAKYLPKQTILVSGASKAYAMTGYRIGFVAAPAALIKEITKFHQYTVTTHINSSMAAATVAFNECDPEIAVMRAEYAKRRDYMVAQLTALGFGVASPDGAFYLFIKMPTRFGTDDTAFALRLAHEAKVALIPGNSFGPGGEGYLRLSYAASQAQLATTIERLAAFLATN